MPAPAVTRSTPRRTIAVVCAVRHDDERDDRRASAPAAMAPASGQRSATPAPAATEQRRAERRARVTTPKLVGRRCVLTRSSALPPPCSSTSARTSSHAQRPTKTLTSRSSDQPSSISIDADRARAPQPVGELRQHAIGRRPGLAPEAIFGDAAGDQQQRAPRFARATAAARGWSAAAPTAARLPAATARRGSGRARARAAG